EPMKSYGLMPQRMPEGVVAGDKRDQIQTRQPREQLVLPERITPDEVKVLRPSAPDVIFHKNEKRKTVLQPFQHAYLPTGEPMEHRPEGKDMVFVNDRRKHNVMPMVNPHAVQRDESGLQDGPMVWSEHQDRRPERGREQTITHRAARENTDDHQWREVTEYM